VEKENLPWRSFAYQEAINEKWGNYTPAYYIIDPKGMIRHKWFGHPGEQAMDRALEKLLKEAESN
jgi:peroxiredoxin